MTTEVAPGTSGSGAVAGFATPRFAELEELFTASVNDGTELGASVAVTVEGETVVDLWGGFADGARTRPWERDTIVNVWSTTKTMTALVALMLADAGDLDLAAPVAHYWPEFGVAGKEEVTVSQFLSHSSGMSGWRAPMGPDDLYDWDKATSLLAAQEPFWEPGTASGYHGMTQGYLVGEVVRRITGRTLPDFLRTEVTEPLGADFHIAFGPELDPRIAELIPEPSMDLPEGFVPTELLMNIAFNPPIDPLAANTRAWRGAEIAAANGHGNARSVAEIHTILANGGTTRGRTFLSEAGCRRALEPQIEGVDLVIGFPLRLGNGFGLSGGIVPIPETTFFWAGRGGSIVLIDMSTRTTFAYTMNRMLSGGLGDTRALSLASAMWTAVGAPLPAQYVLPRTGGAGPGR